MRGNQTVAPVSVIALSLAREAGRSEAITEEMQMVQAAARILSAIERRSPFPLGYLSGVIVPFRLPQLDIRGNHIFAETAL